MSSFIKRSLQQIPRFANASQQPVKRGVVSFARTRTAELPQVFYGRPDKVDTGVFAAVRNGFHRFNDLCLRSPNKAATISSSVVFFSADASAQWVAHKREGKELDPYRCLAMTTFGGFYYGGAVVRLYRFYDHMLGPKAIFRKALFDVTIHTPFGVIPAFYCWTHMFEGRTDSVVDRLKNDWADVSTASVAYWFPVQVSCFAFIPTVHRVAYVSFASFVHKTALSWWAHREPTDDSIELDATPKPSIVDRVKEKVVAEIPDIHETQGCVDTDKELTLGEKLLARSRQVRGPLNGVSYFP